MSPHWGSFSLQRLGEGGKQLEIDSLHLEQQHVAGDLPHIGQLEVAIVSLGEIRVGHQHERDIPLDHCAVGPLLKE